MKKTGLIILTLVLSITLKAQTTQQEYMFNEWNDYFKGVYELPKSNAKALGIYQQLVQYSGMQFYIRYAQTFQWGQAHNGGVILLEYSALAKPIEILAFIMAHEWGHEALGHLANLYNPYGNVWQFRKGQTDDEDAADIYAGKFLAAKGYDVSVVTSFLKNLPATSPWDTHSSGTKRANNVMMGYNSVGGHYSTPTTQYETIRVPCTHLQHPEGDIIPCSHPLHPAGDVIRCQHICQSPYGPIPCHPNGDLIPCSHRAHYNDGITLCTHPMHQYDTKTVKKY